MEESEEYEPGKPVLLSEIRGQGRIEIPAKIDMAGIVGMSFIAISKREGKLIGCFAGIIQTSLGEGFFMVEFIVGSGTALGMKAGESRTSIWGARDMGGFKFFIKRDDAQKAFDALNEETRRKL